MTTKQRESLEKFLDLYKPKSEYLAILLAGSLAHGYAKETSDLDIVLVATEEEFLRRRDEKKLTFSLWDICTYEGGYVDCKVVSLSSLREIAAKGSDPARYAFKDCRILYSRLDNLDKVLGEVTRYPSADRESRRTRFLSQVLAWKWYLSQAEEKANRYLLYLAVQKIVLFAGRVVLNENELLYPYHKWLLEEVSRASNKPEGLIEAINGLLAEPTFAKAQDLSDRIFRHVGRTEKETDWPNQFFVDSEMNWNQHEAPIDDL